jgi:Fis family transcriptional regulator
MTVFHKRNDIYNCFKEELIYKEEINNQLPDMSYLLPEVKKIIVEATLVHTRGNQAKASRMLGINRATLKKYIRI